MRYNGDRMKKDNKNQQIEKEIQKNLDISKLELYKPQYEYRTNVGYIDILAQDKNGFYVVIEIKVGKAKDNAIGQILGYMEAINAKRGIILANSFSERVRLVAKNLNIDLISYKIKPEINEKEYLNKQNVPIINEINSIKNFCNNNLKFTNDFISSDDLYNCYKNWCKNNNIPFSIKKKNFICEFRNLFSKKCKYKQKMIKGKRFRGFFGIKFLNF